MKKLLFTIALLLGSLGVFAQQLPEPMKPARLVNDFVGIFSPQQQQQLEQKLVAFANETSSQIAVVSVADLDGDAISSYAQKLFDKWGVGGNSQKNNGVLILVKPKTATERGEVFIATGYGMEGAVPDALAGRIVDNEMIPAFKQNDYYKGVDAAVNTVMSLTRGEFTAEEYAKKHDSAGTGVFLLVAIFVIFVISFVFSKSDRNDRTYSAGGDVATGILLGSLLSGMGHRGGHGGGGFGGFSGGGGGFGGFGGGFSGGGGAGGSW